jgi:hypothetical protein
LAFCAIVTAILATWLTVPASTQSVGATGASPVSFLRVNQCYRFTFTIAGVPTWKVLERLEGGWVRAEADAGPATAQRESAWINTAQIVTIRDAKCSA